MKKIVWGVSILMVCILAGAFLYNFLTSDSRKMREFALEEEQLQNTLAKSSSNDEKIKALTDFVNFAEKNFHLHRQSDDVPPEVYHDIVISYVKLGNLYEEQKDPKSEKYFSAALRLKGKFVPWMKNFKIETKDDLRRYVAELDQRTNNRTQTSQ